MRQRSRSDLCWLQAMVVAFAVLFSTSVCGNELQILLVLSNDSPPYQAFSNSFTKNLPASIHAKVLQTPENLRSEPESAGLVVSVGMKATEAALHSSKPVFAAMLPQSGYEALRDSLTTFKRRQNFSALYLNQPLARQLDFLFAVLPEMRKLGVLYSPASQMDMDQLRTEVMARGGTLFAQAVDSDLMLSEELGKVLQHSEVLVAFPDSVIYSSSNIRNILLSTYRQNVPLIGWSQSYVNAGAVAALFSSPEQLAEQTALAVRSYAQSGQLPASQYPDAYTIAVNQQVARSLGIALDSDEVIRAQMKKMHGSEHD